MSNLRIKNKKLKRENELLRERIGQSIDINSTLTQEHFLIQDTIYPIEATWFVEKTQLNKFSLVHNEAFEDILRMELLSKLKKYVSVEYDFDMRTGSPIALSKICMIEQED